MTAVVTQLEEVSNSLNTGRRVHLHVELDRDSDGVLYHYRSKDGKKTPRATHNLHVRVFDVIGYSSELTVFPEDSEHRMLSATPLISVTGTRDVAKVLRENFNVHLQWEPELGEPVAEPTRELRSRSKIS